MEVFNLSNNVISKEKMDKLGIKSISIISETDINTPRCIIKYKDGIKKYIHIDEVINTDVKFVEFLIKHVPELK